MLQAAKIAEQLASYSLEDLARKVLLQAVLAYYETLVGDLAAKVNIVVGLANQFSDCPPVGTLMRKVKATRDEYLGPLYELQFEIEQYIASIDDKARKVNEIQKLIDTINTWKDAVDLCGE